MYRNRTLLIALLSFSSIISAENIDAVETQNLGAEMTRLEKAEYLLSNRPRNVDPVAIGQAEAILSGQEGKRWKNCIFDKEVARALNEASETPSVSNE